MSTKNNNQTAPQKPKRIDKHYWLDKGYEMVHNGLSRSNQQIKSIKTYINGLLSIYVLSTIINAIYLEIDAVWKLAIIMLPVIIVKWATFYGTISVLPNLKSFWPDSADSSEITYYQYLDESREHVKKLKDYAFHATWILLSVLVLVTWYTIQAKTKEALNKDELKIAQSKLAKTESKLKAMQEKDIYEMNTKMSKDTTRLFLEATLPKEKFALVKLTTEKDSVAFPWKKILIGKYGKLYYDYPINSQLKLKDSLFIHLKYKLNEQESREIRKLFLLKIAIKK